jgi:hypothetical protein
MVTHKAFQENGNELVLPIPETKLPQSHLVNGGPLHKLLLATDESLSEVKTVLTPINSPSF